MPLSITTRAGKGAALTNAELDANFTNTKEFVEALESAKLDAAAFTGAATLERLLTVDGDGSGLDADLLDGQHASAFAASGHTHTFASLTNKPTTLGGYGITDALPLSGGTLTGIDALKLQGGGTDRAGIQMAYGTRVIGVDSFDILEAGNATYIWQRGNRPIEFGTHNTLRMRLSEIGVYSTPHLHSSGDVYCGYTGSGWFRFYNAGGLYSQTYGVGWQVTANDRIVQYGGEYTVVNTLLSLGDVYAYWSDDRLKTKLGPIDNALAKVLSLSGFLYKNNALANQLQGYDPKVRVGVSAQEVQRVQPEAVGLAPFDNGEGGVSKSGENYLTVQYERLVPLLIEAIKELTAKVNTLEARFACASTPT